MDTVKTSSAYFLIKASPFVVLYIPFKQTVIAGKVVSKSMKFLSMEMTVGFF